MEYDLKIIDVEEESLIEITRFLNECFPHNKKFTLDFVRWQYAQNPLGIMVGFNAWDKGKIISHFAGLPINMNLFGQTYKGLLSINVSTSDRYRGKKLFTILGQATIQHAIESGFDFMIAVPNANSSPAFLKYFGFDLISPLTVKLGIGKNIYPNKKFNCYKEWDDEQWKWRLKNPAGTYSFDKKGIVSTPVTYFTKSVSNSQLQNNNLAITPQSIGFCPLNLYVGLGADTSKGLYFNMPSFIKRPPFNLVFRDFTGKIPKIKKEDIFIQLIDLDTI